MLPADLEAVLFDAGGTLVHLDYVCIAATAGRHGCALEPDALHHAEVASRRAIDAHARAGAARLGSDATRRPGYFETLVRAAGVPDGLLPGVLADLETEHRVSNLWRVPLPGASEALSGLRERGIRTAVVSNADGRVAATLRAVGLAERLELIVDSHDEGVEKPDPEIFRRALARLGLAPERCAYIGDIYSIDAVGARAAGLAPVIIDGTGTYGPVDCAVISRLSELVEALGGAGGGAA